MTSENMISLKQIYDAFEVRDIDTILEAFSPEISITQCPQLPFGGTYHGVDEVKAFFGKVDAHLDDKVIVDRMIDGIDRIVVLGRAIGVVKDTGKSFEVEVMHLWEFKRGLIVRLEIVLDVPVMQAALASWSMSPRGNR
jgi:uncharacterized protein